MSDLRFEVVGARAEQYAAVPTLMLRLAIRDAGQAKIHAIGLRIQIQIESQRRHYAARGTLVSPACALAYTSHGTGHALQAGRIARPVRRRTPAQDACAYGRRAFCQCSGVARLRAGGHHMARRS